MLATRILPASRMASTIVGRPLLASSLSKPHAIRALAVCVHQRRDFSLTSRATFNPTESQSVTPTQRREDYTESSWPHPVYTEEEMNSIHIAHRNAKTWSDYVALYLVKTLRRCFDLATGYTHDKAVANAKKPASQAWQKFKMTERKWLIRAIFLESIAGVPGMVGGMVRHLHSLRRMKRDNGWIETLLEEAYNERVHLLTFLKMADPGWFMRVVILGAQGVFFNSFFLGYLISPRTAHRFVGYIEEEAVITYTRIISDLETPGKLPYWEREQAPDIAVQYWKMPEGHRSIKDMMYYIRADEAKHREVNHTLANLEQGEDPNPFVATYKDDGLRHPGKGVSGKPTGWERDECISK